MANVCDFLITVRGGDPETIRKVKEFLGRAVEHKPGAFYGDYFLSIDMPFHDLGSGEHHRIGRDGAEYERVEHIEDNVFYLKADGSLYISGVSR